jgi:hypothetical protein
MYKFYLIPVRNIDNPATKHREASSDYFALAPVNQLDEVVSQSMSL